jgi:hypothetical protein
VSLLNVRGQPVILIPLPKQQQPNGTPASAWRNGSTQALRRNLAGAAALSYSRQPVGNCRDVQNLRVMSITKRVAGFFHVSRVRHSSELQDASRPERGGDQPRAIQGWLGHRSVTSTAVYTALAPNRLQGPARLDRRCHPLTWTRRPSTSLARPMPSALAMCERSSRNQSNRFIGRAAGSLHALQRA